MAYLLEKMSDRHCQPVIDIFNHYITGSFAAYLDGPVDYTYYQRFLDITTGYPAVVIKDEGGTVVGFAFLHPYRPGKTFQRTAEITYFILPEHTRKGLGGMVLEDFSREARKQGIEILLANISSKNEGSLLFHAKHGFQQCGIFKGIGRKFNQDFDVVWMQLEL
jgi:L-amino acid N-acyltransferase YncA